jgi:PAS domain S-box-containing protein
MKEHPTPTVPSARTGSIRILWTYSVLLLPFVGMILSAAIVIQDSNLGYVLLGCAVLTGIGLGGLLAAAASHPETQKPRFHRLLQLVPGWNAVERRIEELQESIELLEIRNQTLTDNIAAAIIIRDAAGELLYCSPYIEVLTGYAQEEIYESDTDFFSTIVHQDDREKVQRSLKVSQFGEAFQFRCRFYHKTGLLMWAETRTVPLLDDSGTIQALLSITFDVTGSMRYQEKVEEHNQDLKDFSYMLSHDLKGPMETIRGMLNALREDFGTSLPADASSLIGHAERASERLQTLVASVIEYSRVSNLEERQQPVECHQIAAEVAQELSTSLASCDGTLDLSPLPRVWGDYTMLYQIFLNLFGNSIKYRSPERTLHIVVSATTEPDERTVCISVSDNGLGIPPDRLDDIFRPFHRAHGKDIEGSGIGLACVKKLTERIGGTISVRNNSTDGSCFELRLQLADTAARHPLA